ncbi:MAG: M28 family peptidase [Bacteroidales bacterium]
MYTHTMVRVLYLIVILLTLFGFTPSEEAKERGLSKIRPEAGKAIVTFLAHDLLEGREAGSRGGAIAAAWLASELCKLNLIPFPASQGDETGYLHSFGGVTRRGDTLAMQNALGYIKGSTNEWIVVGAHYDHLGSGGGAIFNGADDNASGVSAVLQIAAGFVASNTVPQRNVLFALWDGEEKGLLGSGHFANHQMAGMTIKAYMNFDMIGRDATGSEPGHVDYFYTAAFPRFAQWLKAHIEQYNLPLRPVYRAWDKPDSGSDNASFAAKGVPILWYHTNSHPDYHKVSDHSDKINWTKMYHITQSAYLTVWKLANLDNPTEPVSE